jgi:hypothetical protein
MKLIGWSVIGESKYKNLINSLLDNTPFVLKYMTPLTFYFDH